MAGSGLSAARRRGRVRPCPSTSRNRRGDRRPRRSPVRAGARRCQIPPPHLLARFAHGAVTSGQRFPHAEQGLSGRVAERRHDAPLRGASESGSSLERSPAAQLRTGTPSSEIRPTGGAASPDRPTLQNSPFHRTAGTTVAGRDTHPLERSASARRTRFRTPAGGGTGNASCLRQSARRAS